MQHKVWSNGHHTHTQDLSRSATARLAFPLSLNTISLCLDIGPLTHASDEQSVPQTLCALPAAYAVAFVLRTRQRWLQGWQPGISKHVVRSGRVSVHGAVRARVCVRERVGVRAQEGGGGGHVILGHNALLPCLIGYGLPAARALVS